MFVIILHPIYFNMPHFKEKMKFGITHFREMMKFGITMEWLKVLK